MDLENILGWIVILAFPLGAAWGLYRIVKRHNDETARLQAKWEADMKEQMSRLEKLKSARSQQKTANNTPPKKSEPPKYSSTATATSTSTVAQPVNNWSDDLLTTMIIADMLSNHKDTVAGTVSWKDDIPTIKETYSEPSPKSSSWGFDDDDSRKSASSSFSSSDSSSSWGDSSSSDSGPSSDW